METGLWNTDDLSFARFQLIFRMFFILVVLKISVKKTVKSALYRHQLESKRKRGDRRPSSLSHEFNDGGDANLAAIREVTSHPIRRLPPSRQVPISAGHFSRYFPAVQGCRGEFPYDMGPMRFDRRLPSDSSYLNCFQVCGPSPASGVYLVWFGARDTIDEV
jgi:hypothetical protein